MHPGVARAAVQCEGGGAARGGVTGGRPTGRAGRQRNAGRQLVHVSTGGMGDGERCAEEAAKATAAAAALDFAKAGGAVRQGGAES
jgi:hypothetical protein